MANKELKSIDFGSGDKYFPLPLITSSQNSQVLTVVNGEWAPAPLKNYVENSYIWKKFTAKDGDFIEYVGGEDNTEYPSGGTQDGYWYELVSIPSKIYGVSIDLTNSNSETSCTYIDDAVGMTGGSVDWDNTPIFKNIKPCLFKNGAVVGYLNPNNYAEFIDGTPADITSGNAGDVMIQIPKMGYKIETSADGNTLTVQVTNGLDKGADGFKYYAHTRDVEGDRDYIYVGAYKGYYDGSKLRSLSGKSPTASQNISTFRGYAQANGSGYDMTTFYALTLLQCLFIIRYKNLNSQTALGIGWTNGSAATSTGSTNTRGLYYGSTSNAQVKCFGIEDLWGNIYEWIDGLYCDSSRNILTAFKNFNNTGSGYTNHGQGASSNIYGYMTKSQGTSESGFIAKETSGSSTTYFSDYGYLSAGRLPVFGGHWGIGANVGMFLLIVNFSASNAYSYIGARVLYV